MRAHPAAALFPMLSEDDLAALAADIAEHGQREPIVIFEDKILDGRNRHAACKIAKVEPKTKVLAKCDSPTAFVISLNLKRRHLTPLQNAQVGVDALPLFSAEAKARQKDHGGTAPGKTNTQGRTAPKCSDGKATSEAAKHTHAGQKAVRDLAAVQKKAPEVSVAVRAGVVDSVADAKRLASMPEGQRAAVLAELTAAPKGSEPKARKRRKSLVAAAARQQRVAKLVELAAASTPLTGALGTFPVVYADPPWRYEHVETESRAVENQYPTMDLDAICAMPLADITTPDAILFLWATSPKLAEAMRVVTSWGFTYRTCAVWTKDKIGMGYYFRQQHELLLVATKGSPPAPPEAARVSSVIRSNRFDHSAKPLEAVETIERMYPDLPKVELFSRTRRKGWKVWGNQSEAAE